MATPNGEGSVAWFEWGTNGDYGQVTAATNVGNGSSVVRVGIAISNLAFGGVYSCRLVVSNASGLVYGAEQRFTTGENVADWGYANWVVSSFGVSGVPVGLTNAVAVAGGSLFSLALKNDGSVIAWGNNSFGQTNVPGGLSNMVAIAADGFASIALKQDGTVVAWGNNANGTTNVPVSLSNVVAIAANLALKADGTVVAWGTNYNVPNGLSNMVAISGGNLALKNNGTVVAWGNDSFGQTNVPVGLTNVVAIAAGADFNLALKNDGTVIAWGHNNYGQTNLPVGLSNVVMIAAGGAYSLALRSDGTLIAWGSDNYGETTIPPGLTDIAALAGGDIHSLALCTTLPYATTQSALGMTATGATLCGMATANNFASTAWFEWGTNNSYGQSTSVTNIGNGNNVVRVTAPIDGLVLGGAYSFRLVVSNVAGVTYGMEQRFTTGQHLVGWGNYISVPPGMNNVVAAAIGNQNYTGLALKNDGVLVSFGGPSMGTNIVAAAVGGAHTLALKTDGRVIAWGNNTYGQANVPSDLTNVVAIAAGTNHSLALTADGIVVAWGDNLHGETSMPPGLNNVVAIAANAYLSLALRNDGTAAMWGDNYGYLSLIPLDHIVAISCDMHSAVVLKTDGTVATWNFYLPPTLVPNDLSNVVAIASGYYHHLALKSDETVVVWADWGYGTYGQTNVPNGLSNVVVIAAGGNFSLAIAPDHLPTADNQSVFDQGSDNVVIQLSGSDPDDSSLNFRIFTLPSSGTLHQFCNGRGPAIWETNTLVTDPDGLIVFVPATNGFTSFEFVADDGNTNSPPATVTIEVTDQPPTADAQSVSSHWNTNLVIQLSGSDPDEGSLYFRVMSLPANGVLYQCGEGSQGEPIVGTNTLIADPNNFVVFVPATNGFGSPYASFNFVTDDGIMRSAPAMVTIEVSAPSKPQVSCLWHSGEDGSFDSFELDFNGDDWATYSVWTSTNLMDWEQLGPATMPLPGVFQFIDPDVVNWPQRFYRVGAP